MRESARVQLNGRHITTAWSLPFRMRVGEHLQPGRNVLELEVTNLAANRIRDLDRRKEPWKVMREINFVNINYRPFDASGWPLTPSGLLGRVTLRPLRPPDISSRVACELRPRTPCRATARREPGARNAEDVGHGCGTDP